MRPRFVLTVTFMFIAPTVFADTTGGARPDKAIPYRVYLLIQRAQEHLDNGNELRQIQLPDNYIGPTADLDDCLDQIESKSDDINIVFAGLELCRKRHPIF